MGRSGNDVPGALLHNTIAQDMREQPLNESFENDTLDLINVVTKAQRLNLFILENVRIYLKSQENSKKRVNTDTRIRRVQKEAKESKPKPEISSLSQKQSKHGQ
ncbi:hypothetical protein Tco_1167571 [Tanacetum coccineum]